MTAMPATLGCTFAVPNIRRLDIVTAVLRSTGFGTIRFQIIEIGKNNRTITPSVCNAQEL
jgi:hypothetical protein